MTSHSVAPANCGKSTERLRSGATRWLSHRSMLICTTASGWLQLKEEVFPWQFHKLATRCCCNQIVPKLRKICSAPSHLRSEVRTREINWLGSQQELLILPMCEINWLGSSRLIRILRSEMVTKRFGRANAPAR